MNSKDAQNRIANMIAAPAGKIARRNAEKDRKNAAVEALMLAVAAIKIRRRDNPKEWESGYNSSITAVELLINEIETGEVVL